MKALLTGMGFLGCLAISAYADEPDDVASLFSSGEGVTEADLSQATAVTQGANGEGNPGADYISTQDATGDALNPSPSENMILRAPPNLGHQLPSTRNYNGP